jgi:hypothetical protein
MLLREHSSTFVQYFNHYEFSLLVHSTWHDFLSLSLAWSPYVF